MVVIPNFGTALDDLVAATTQPAAKNRDATSTLPVADIDVRSAIADLLAAAGRHLPGVRLARVCDAAIFQCDDSVFRPLASWDAPAANSAHHVPAELREAFAGTALPLLSETEARRLEVFLAAAGRPPASFVDLLKVAGGGLAPDADPWALRQALINSRDQLPGLAEEHVDALHALPIWPTRQGLLPASKVLRRRDITRWVEDDTFVLWSSSLDDDEASLLLAEADVQAEQLEPWLTFSNPLTAFERALSRIAKVGTPVAEQAELLATPERAAAVAVAFVRGRAAESCPTLETLPVGVNLVGELVPGDLLLGDEHELVFCAELPFAKRIGHPRWSAIVHAADADAVGKANPRQVLAALVDTPGHASTVFADGEIRRAFYQWLEARCDAFADDEQSRGLLGKIAFVRSGQGAQRAPTELLFDRELPDLGIDWNPADELPSRLVTWLRAAYRPATKQLRPLSDKLLDAADAAIDARDGDRLASIIAHLARALRPDQEGFGDRVRRLQLRKRLRVESASGEFKRPRTLLASTPHDGDLIARFADPMPQRVSRRYEAAETVALLVAAGADAELSEDALRSFLDGNALKPGPDAKVALACYVAGLGHRIPELRNALALRDRTWLVDQNGTPHRPEALYWPSDNLTDLIGEREDRLVHPEVVHRVPNAHEWIGTRDSASADLEDVLATIAAQPPASSEVLAWLNAGLTSGSIDGTKLRDALSHVPMLVDDLGVLRRPGEVVIEGARYRFGDQRGDWSRGAQLGRLASALRIARRPGKRDVVSFISELCATVDWADGVAKAEGKLWAERLPRCLDLLVDSGGHKPPQLAVACHRHEELYVCLLPEAAARIRFAGDEGVGEFEIVLADGAQHSAWASYLAHYGVVSSIGARETSRPPSVVENATGPTIQETFQHGAEPEESAKPKPSEPSPPKGEEGPGFLTRMRQWLRGNDKQDEETKPRPDRRDSTKSEPSSFAPPPAGGPSGSRSQRRPPPARRDPKRDRRWFRSRSNLEEQLADGTGWLADRQRAGTFGLAHSPASLPLPYQYAPQVLYAGFSSWSQSWQRFVGDGSWFRGTDSVGRVRLRGKLPGGEAVIPVPLFGQVSLLQADGMGNGLDHLVDAAGLSVWLNKEDAVVTVEVELFEPPNMENGDRPRRAPRALLEPTVADAELPDEVHDIAASARNETDVLTAAETVRSFIRERYVYDPTYLEDPSVAAWLRQRSRGRSNVHVAALHASSDADTLGRGVCYELNALACELLRRAGIPAVVATGWTFDRGFVDEPDHLWAMALVETNDGSRWLPVDAASTREGRPLRVGPRPPGPWKAPAPTGKPAQRPRWLPVRASRKRKSAVPISDLFRVARYLEKTTDAYLGNRAELLAACETLLRDPERSKVLAKLLAELDERQ